MSSAVEWLEIWSTPRLPEADSLGIFAACVAALLVISLLDFYLFLFFWNQVLETVWVRCCSCAMRLVEQPKTKRLGHPEWFFLIELNSCKEGKEGKNEWMNGREHLKKTPNTASTLLFSGFREKLQRRFRDVSHATQTATLLQEQFKWTNSEHAQQEFWPKYRLLITGKWLDIGGDLF